MNLKKKCFELFTLLREKIKNNKNEKKELESEIFNYNLLRAILFGIFIIIFNFINVIIFKKTSIIVMNRDYFLFYNIITLIFIVYLSLNYKNSKPSFFSLAKLLYVLFIIITLNSFFPYILSLQINGQFFYIISIFILLFSIGPLLDIKKILICLLFTNIFPIYLLVNKFNDFNYLKIIFSFSIFLIIFSQILYVTFYKYIKKMNLLKNKTIKFKQLAVTDELTGLLNRHGIETKLKKLKINNNIALIIIDIDFFKDFNDKYGHLKGDICLRKVAHAIKNSTKKQTDFVARYGGEEFIVIVNDLNKTKVINIAKRILKNIEDLKINAANKKASRFVTASAGIVINHDKNDFNYLKLLNEADKQLMRIKKNKRNSISFENRTISN